MRTEALPDAVRPLLSAWVGEVLGVLGDGIASVALYGGIALGDFAPRWSDIDVCVTLRRMPTPAEVSALGSLHRSLFARFVERAEGGWASEQFVEGFLVGPDLLADPRSQGPGISLHEGAATHHARIEVEPFDRLLLADAILPLTGPRPVVAPASDAMLARQLRADLDRLELGARRSAVWRAGMLHEAARSLVFWRDGELVGKTEALEREIARDEALAAPFALARRCRDEGAAWTRTHEDEVAAAFDLARPHVLERLLPYA